MYILLYIYWGASWREGFLELKQGFLLDWKSLLLLNAEKGRHPVSGLCFFFSKIWYWQTTPVSPPFPVHYYLGLSFKTLRLYTAWKDSKTIIDSFIQNCLPGSLVVANSVYLAKLFVMMLTVGTDTFPSTAWEPAALCLLSISPALSALMAIESLLPVKWCMHWQEIMPDKFILYWKQYHNRFITYRRLVAAFLKSSWGEIFPHGF